MTKSTITRERMEEIRDCCWMDDLGLSMDELSELARMALAAMDSEPVIIVGDDGGDALSYRRLIQSFAPGTKLYRHAQPASERDQVRSAHAEWSQATFGNVGPVGPLKHLSKEALEAAAEPGDLSEWADMQFLLWDAQRRAGITDEQITQAMIEKLAVNKQRKWPEPKDGEPRLHIKEQPAPVVLVIPDEMTSGQAYEIGYYYGDPVDVFARGANWMRQHIIDSTLAAAPQSPGSDPATVPGKWISVSERMPENDGAYLCWDNRYVTTYAFIFGAWQANQFIAKNITHWMPLPAAPQEVNRE